MDGERVWATMEAQGRKITWLAREASKYTRTPLVPRRLYHLKYAAAPRGPYLWRPEEREAVSRALGKSQRWLFGAPPTVRGICLACGKAGRVSPLRGHSGRGALVPRRDQATGDGVMKS